MNSNANILNHDTADPLLDDYVLGRLPSSDQIWMTAHVETCEICKSELPDLQEALLAMPFGVDEAPVEMSSDLWNRIELSILSQAPAQTQSQAQHQTWPSARSESSPIAEPGAFQPLDISPSPSVAGAKKSNVTHLGSAGRGSISRLTWFGLAAAAVTLLGLGAVLGQALGWFSNSPEDSAQVIAIHNPDGEPLDVAQLQYLPNEHVFVLKMDGMPAAPDGQVYQAWFIAGDTPIPMGLINPATGEFAASGLRENYDAFAITVEPGPMGSELPTSDPIAVAPLQAEN